MERIILSNGQIDVHNRARTYQQSLAKLEKSSISAKNKQLIQTFMRDCELGKTQIGQASALESCAWLRFAAF